MADRAAHCPFLNRADGRCAERFRLDGLGHALAHCFDRYRLCPTYLERLVERRVRRARTRSQPETAHADSFAQITIAGANPQSAPDRARVPAVLGV